MIEDIKDKPDDEYIVKVGSDLQLDMLDNNNTKNATISYI